MRRGRMDALPDDVAAIAGVSRSWRACVPFIPSLCFPRTAACADDAIGRMVEAAARLEELHILCPFSLARQPGWIATRSAPLRPLGLHLGPGAGSGHLDCVGTTSDLQELRLRGMAMTRAPAWGQMERLRVLVIVGASLDGRRRRRVPRSQRPRPAPLPLLRLRVLRAPPCSSTAALTSSPEAPHVESLELQGFSWISLEHDDGTGDRLKRLTIANDNGSVYTACIGRLPVLEQLSLRGVQ